MAAAGREVLECRHVLARTGDNVVAEILRHQGTFYEWDHYPAGDVYDAETHAQYYYHAHAAGERGGEHGHFHTFLRPRGMPIGVSPSPVPDPKLPDDPDDALSHLIAISMDAGGEPLRLFTTNRWVTGEVWYADRDVLRMLDAFRIGHAQPSWPTNRWISAMLVLFRPQIRTLVRERDRVLTRHALAHPEVDPFEDRRLEVTSDVAIDVDEQIAAVEEALRAGA